MSDWLNTPGLERCYLIEAEYQLEGDTKTLRVATHGYRTDAEDLPPWTPYPDVVLSIGTYGRGFSDALTGQSERKLSTISLYRHPVHIEPLLRLADFANRPVRIYVGDKTWPRRDFIVIAELVGAQLLASSQTQVELSFTDSSALFDVPVLTDTYPLNNGSSAIEGRFKPRAFGQCFNVSPELINSANHVYQVSDSQIQAITDVRENGASIPFTADLTAGTFTLENAPTGTITCDVQGAVIHDVYLTTATQMLRLFLSELGIDNIGEFDDPGYTLGLYLNSDVDYTTYLDVINAITTSIGYAWYLSRESVFTLYRIESLPDYTPSTQVFNPLDVGALLQFGQVEPLLQAGASVELEYDDFGLQNEIELGSLKPVERIPPITSVRIGYAHNHTVLDSVAGVVSETQSDFASVLAQEYQYAEASDNNVAIAYNDAQYVERNTLLVFKADALAEAERTLALSLVPRFVYQLTAYHTPLAMDVGQVISVQDDVEFPSGTYVNITQIEDNLDADAAYMEVLV